MTSTERTWLSPGAHKRLQEELATLRELTAVSAPDSDTSAIAVQRARVARIQRIHDLLANATVGEQPPDDGVAEPGMVLTVRFDDTGDTETFLLGVREAEVADMEIYSVRSPLGAAVVGAKPGEQRSYQTPGGVTIPVTLLGAVPYGLHETQFAS